MKALVGIFFGFGILFANLCEDKISDIEKQIKIAKQHNETNKIEGLNTALKNLKDKCSNNKITDKLHTKINKYENKIKDAKADIQEAKAKGKIAKQKAEEVKLKTFESELEKAKKELANYLESI